MTLEDIIETVSEYTVGFLPTDDISNDRLEILTSSTSSRVARLNPGFTGDELLLFQAYIILDAWVNRPGTGPIIEEKTFETSYKTKIHSSSYYMDIAHTMIQEYNEKLNSGSFEVATRADSEMPELSEHEFEEYYEEA